MKNEEYEFNSLLTRIEEFKKENRLDISVKQDLIIAIMNLISTEEHLVFTGAKTKKLIYYDLITQIREMRVRLLKKIVRQHKGEIWCVIKHLLSSAMRLIEVGYKYQTLNKREKAYNYFEDGYRLYSLAVGLESDSLDLPDRRSFIRVKRKSHTTITNQAKRCDLAKKDPSKVKKLIKKVKDRLNCCIE